ncbi:MULTISPECIES: hypothetical protein [unclassified Streptomyces]|uniref:hypothetical protein n=1 Tax=unclassified Streptomyces TaxID=2593676 RepID=UPI00336AD24A
MAQAMRRQAAAPNDRRITGVTVTARNEQGVEVPKAATVAARQALKPLKNDPERMARGRGKAAAVTPEQLRQMNAAVADGLTGLRDRALWLMAFAIAGRSAEVAALRADSIIHVSQGLEVHALDPRRVGLARAPGLEQGRRSLGDSSPSPCHHHDGTRGALR